MQVTILDMPIRQTADGLFCLNDLHKAAGGAAKDLPSQWLQSRKAKDLVNALNARNARNAAHAQVLDSIHHGKTNDEQNQALRVIHGDAISGINGTFAERRIVYAYAEWISTDFHLHVLDVFDAHVQAQIAALAQDATSYQAIAMSSDDMLISDAAIILKIKQKEFFTFLSKGLGWIFKRGNIWRPRQKAVEDGFVARRCSKYFKDGEEKRSYQTVITERGMAFAQQRRLA